MEKLKFIQVPSEEFKKEILDEVTRLINEIKNHFEPKKPTELLTRRETAELFQIDLSTLYLWTKKGKLKSYGLGARVYYKRSEIEQALVAQ